jgi:protein-S-isoprenylcysteine O-methyltransferase Ste14
MTALFLLIPIAAVVAIWFLLNWRESKRAAQNLPRHSGLRLVFAAVAALLVLFSGGCGALFTIDMISRGGPDVYISYELVAVLSLPFVALGLLVWWLAMRRPKP